MRHRIFLLLLVVLLAFGMLAGAASTAFAVIEGDDCGTQELGKQIQDQETGEWLQCKKGTWEPLPL